MTLYLSRLRLDPRNRIAAANLARPYELHRTLLRAFPGSDSEGFGRVLFRVEPMPRSRAAEATVIVQSETEPDWIEACREYPPGMLLAPPQLRGLPATFPVGTLLRFRLRANPCVRRCRLPDGTRDERRQRPRHGLYREEDQIDWLIRQGRSKGFELMASDATSWFETEGLCARYDLVVRDEGTMVTDKKTTKGVSRHYSVVFEGLLHVTAPPAFSNGLRSGIGPGKAFGFGLLSIAPVNT